MLRPMLRLKARSTFAAVALAAALGSGCADATSARGGGPGCPPACPAPALQPAAASAAPATPGPILAGFPGEAPAFDPARITPVLEDARLASARGLVEREAYAKAAQEIEAAMNATPAPAAEDGRAWLYQLGRIRALAGDPLGAARAYDAAAAAGGPLADHARFAAAQLLGQAGDADGALARARAIQPGLAIEAELELVIAGALAQKGDIEGAAARWRSYLGRSRRPAQWVQVTLRFARALLEHPSEAHAEEAARLARRVIDEAPGGAGGEEARGVEGQALGTLPSAKRKPFESPAPDELLARARGLVAARQSKEALRAADALMARPEAAGPSEFACEAAGLRAEALELLKRKAEASDAHGEAMSRCEGGAGRAEALYRAGRAAMRAGAPAEAARRFALLEKELPKHRLADDARYHGARAMLALGDEAQFVRVLSAMPEDYPEGDMVADGLFDVALFEIERGSWGGAVVPLTRALERFPRERAYHAAGRLPYYLGRAQIETGSREQGVALLERTIREYPLTYYMALAHARLGEIDPAAAARVVAEALDREEAAPFEIARSPVFAEPAFLRAVELARQGEARLARGELDLLGVGARTAPAELLWASAFLLARAGAPAQSHGILRTAMNAPRPDRVELTEWLDHYPAGRWRPAWELAYPRPFAGLVVAEAKRHGIPEALAYAIMREESAFEPRVSSPANAHGLMQLIVPTAKRMAKPLGLPWDAEALKRPEVNVALGCRYLSILRKEFPDNPLLAIPGYNAGGGAPRKWIAERPAQSFDLWVERIPYEETRLYTKRVLTSLAAYELLYAREKPSEALRTPLPASPTALSAIASVPSAAP